MPTIGNNMYHKNIASFEPLLKGLHYYKGMMVYTTKARESQSARFLHTNSGVVIDINPDKGGTIGEFFSPKYGEMFEVHEDFHLLGDKRDHVKGNYPVFPSCRVLLTPSLVPVFNTTLRLRSFVCS
jgi:hypothetical protein